jgi:hypothetical protein
MGGKGGGKGWSPWATTGSGNYGGGGNYGNGGTWQNWQGDTGAGSSGGATPGLPAWARRNYLQVCDELEALKAEKAEQERQKAEQEREKKLQDTLEQAKQEQRTMFATFQQSLGGLLQTLRPGGPKDRDEQSSAREGRHLSDLVGRHLLRRTTSEAE